MLTNYHTHTQRCHHASGTERDYVEKAIQAGIQVLGFSDHAPYLFDGDYYSTFRMRPEATGEYSKAIRTLAEEHKGEIRLLNGFEIEYYPALFSRTVRFLADFDCDYLILGQHFIGNEEHYAGRTGDFQIFDRYINQIIEGLETGMFTYLCHPDLCMYMGDAAVREKGFVKLCEAARRLNVPLELNMYGLMDGRHYPCEEFFRIAAQVGNTVVAGYDAHDPNRLGSASELENTRAFAARCGVSLVELSAEQVLSRKKNIK